MKIFSCIRRFFLTLLSRDRERREARPRDESSPLIVVRIPPARTYVAPRHQNLRFPYLYFKFACLSNIINELFPFKYPMNDETLILGGILTSICI